VKDGESELPPCPFCGAGETKIRETTHWTGRSNTVISVHVVHWCPRVEGQPQSIINLAGKTREDAIRAWQSRATP